MSLGLVVNIKLSGTGITSASKTLNENTLFELDHAAERVTAKEKHDT